MARIAGVDLPKGKRIVIGLTYIYGVGLSTSQTILTKLGIDHNLKTDDLSDGEVNMIRKVIDDELTVEGETPVANINKYQTTHGSGMLSGLAPSKIVAL